MNDDAVGTRGPAPRAEHITTRKPMKYLGTLLATGTEEAFNPNGTSKRVTTVRRSLGR